MRKKRLSTTIRAESMADIAFLLLIFFLVSTQILNDKGIKVLLPEYSEIAPKRGPRNSKILSILINYENNLMVNKERSDIVFLKDNIKHFITNPSRVSDLPSSPSKAIISIDSDDNSSYGTYVEVYSEIKQAYIELWREAAWTKYRKPIEQITEEELKQIKNKIPLKISEAERRF